MSQSLEFKIPEGYVFDKDNSTDEVIRFKPIKKKITYNDICRELFLDRPSWRLTDLGTIIHATCTSSAIIHHKTINTSEKQLEQLLALNKLMNVAKYLNGNWEPDWNTTSESKWCIFFDHTSKKLDIFGWNHSHYTSIVFKTPPLARQAIEILGEEEVKKALGIFE